jgi:hypothetical protein
MDAETRQFFATLVKSDTANNQCIDCGTAHPQWASISYGTYFCLQCSGVHRSLGVHISFVRSISMDTWDAKQKKFMEMGGNAAFKRFAEEQGIDGMQIRDKYHTVAANYYREMMKAKYDGSAPPALPAAGTGKNSTQGAPRAAPAAAASSTGTTTPPSSGYGNSKMGGFGNPNFPQPAANTGYGPGGYQGGSSGGNPYPTSTDEAFAMAQGLFASASKAAGELAATAGQKLNETKDRAADEGWFDFDNLKAQASDWANNAQGAVFTNSSSSLDPSRYGTPPDSGPPSQAAPGWPNQELSRPTSAVSSAPAPQKPLAFSTPSQSAATSSNQAIKKDYTGTAPKATPALSMTPPDVAKNAADKKNAKADVWDSDAWFDDF